MKKYFLLFVLGAYSVSVSAQVQFKSLPKVVPAAPYKILTGRDDNNLPSKIDVAELIDTASLRIYPHTVSGLLDNNNATDLRRYLIQEISGRLSYVDAKGKRITIDTANSVLVFRDSFNTHPYFRNCQKNITDTFTVCKVGDSRVEGTYTPIAFYKFLGAIYGYAGYGWNLARTIPQEFFNSYTENNVVKEKSTNSGASASLLSMNGSALILTGVGSFVQMGNTVTEPIARWNEIDVWYQQGGSKILTLTIDGAATTINTGSGTGLAVRTLQTSLGFHTIRFELTSGANAALYEVMLKNTTSKGARILIEGNSGYTSGNQAALNNYAYLSTAYKINVFFIRFGANDLSANTPSVTSTNLKTIVQNIRAVAPNSAIAVIGETDNTGASAANVVPYNLSMDTMCRANEIPYIDFYTQVPNWASFRAQGFSATNDPVHENLQGAYKLATFLKRWLYHGRLEPTNTSSNSSGGSVTGTPNRLTYFGSAGSLTASSFYSDGSKIVGGATANNGEFISLYGNNKSLLSLGYDYGNGGTLNYADQNGYTYETWFSRLNGASFISTFGSNSPMRLYANQGFRIEYAANTPSGSTVSFLDGLYLKNNGEVQFGRYSSANVAAQGNHSATTYWFTTLDQSGFLLNKTRSQMLTDLGIANIRSTAGGVTFTASDDVICVTTAVGCSLPSPVTVGNGKRITVKNLSTGFTLMSTAGTIDGATTYTFLANNKYATFISDGVNWFVIANN